MASKPNIILIVLDTVRPDHLSCYEYFRNTTPFIDKIAEEGTLFENCYSSSCWTLPSHTSFFTGTHLSQHNIGDGGDELDKNFTTIASLLKQENYNTFGLCYIPWVSKLTGLDQGFDTFIDEVEPHFLSRSKSFLTKFVKSQNSKNSKNKIPEEVARIPELTKSKLHWYKTLFFDDGADQAVNKFFTWLENRKSSPFFAFLNFREAHAVYHPPLKYRNKFLQKSSKKLWEINQDHREFMYSGLPMSEDDFDVLNSLYDGEIAYLDSKVKQIYEFLQAKNVLDNTLIIITSDHGEQFGEKGLMGHARNLYNSLLRVPFILRYPDAFPKNKRVHSPIQTIDLFSTITHLLDIDVENVKQKIQSYNLLDVTNYRDDRLIISEYKDQPFEGDVYKKYNDELLQKFRYASRSIVRNEFKYIWKSNGQNELYNLKNDKDEDFNLINSYQDIELALEDELNEWLAGFQSNALVAEEKTDFEADDKIKAQLQALGYL